MAKNKCPHCGSSGFFVKNPDDQYETYEFHFQDGTMVLTDAEQASNPPDIVSDTETYCQKCTWRGTFKTIS
jgi:hypothetical protein